MRTMHVSIAWIGLSGGVGLTWVAVSASPTYTDSGEDHCAECHGDFNPPGGGNYISLKDGTEWGFSLMDGHLVMGADCLWCHMALGQFTPVFTNRSGDSVHNRGCVGCHGRTDDETGVCASGVPDDGTQHCGTGAGLRQQHVNSMVTGCTTCHINDADPAIFTPVGEDNPTIFNGLDGCNDAMYGPTGLDNDADLLEDGDDPDCCPTDLTGDGVTDAADLALLLGAWGPNPANPSDLTGDGVVDAADLALLLGGWGACG